MKLFNFLKLWEQLRTTARRFPLAIIITLLVTVILISVVHSTSNNADVLVQIIWALMITFFLSVWVTIHSENIKNISQRKKHALQGLCVIFGGLFFWQFNGDLDIFENALFFLLSLIGVLGYIFSAPYLQKKIFHPEVYYNYLYSTLSAFILAFIVGILILVLWMIAIGTVDTLLFNIWWDIFEYWIILSCALMAPIFGLSYLPEHTSVTEKIAPLNNFARFIIKYALFPAVCIYFIILYSYSVKLGFTFGDWPKWEISWLIIGFSILGYMTYILSYIYEKENSFIALFRKYFPYLVLPQVIILFYSIYLRIAQYDLTMNRYFIVIFGICLTGLSLYFIVSKAKRLIAFPVAFILSSLIISIWPWSIYQLPANSQLASLKWELVEANILQGDTIVPLENIADISQELSNSIYTKIDYLCDYHSCHGLEEVFSEVYLNWGKDDSKWDVRYNIINHIKVDWGYKYRGNNDGYMSVKLSYSQSFFPLDISQYSEIIEVRSYNYNSDDITAAQLNLASGILTLGHPQISEIDMSEVIADLQLKKGTNSVSPDELTYEVETSAGVVKMLIKSISGNISEQRGSIEAFILIP